MPAALRASLIILIAGVGLGAAASGGRAPELAEVNDNTRLAGTRSGRVLAVTLERRVAGWSPSGDPRLAYVMHAWAEGAGPAQVPGPLVRARVGDTLRLTLRNPGDRDLAVAGFLADSILVPAGAERTVTVPLTRAGSFRYTGVTHRADDPPGRPSPFPDLHEPRDETLLGAFVVDEAEAPADLASRERVFLIHVGGVDSIGREMLTRAAALGVPVPDVNVYINGASWPRTERLRYTVGDSVHWRVINGSFLAHPMHLHGFYFRVDAKGDGQADTVYAPGERRMAVTEVVDGYATARLSWVPEREGNWLFHCHFLRHIVARPVSPAVVASGRRLLAADSAAGRVVMTAEPAGEVAGAHDGTHDGTAHARDHMAGMVMGIHVSPRGLAAPRESTVPAAPQRLRLWVTGRERSADRPAGVGYVLQEGATAPAADSVRVAGPTLRLTQGVPVEITVRNARPVPVSVHWHGIELDSRYDGVGGWSGRPGSITPPIAAGDSFVVRFTPPRAGTFIYHTHDEQERELALGLYGAIVVAQRGGERPVAAGREQVLVFGSSIEPGTRARPPVPRVNGDTLVMVELARRGPTTLRLVEISEHELRRVRLLDAEGRELRWRLVAKDGWTPPASQRGLRAARARLGVGETMDVEIAPEDAAQAVALEVETSFYPHWRQLTTQTRRLPVRVLD